MGIFGHGAQVPADVRAWQRCVASARAPITARLATLVQARISRRADGMDQAHIRRLGLSWAVECAPRMREKCAKRRFAPNRRTCGVNIVPVRCEYTHYVSALARNRASQLLGCILCDSCCILR